MPKDIKLHDSTFITKELSTLINSIYNGVIIIDNQGYILSINNTAEFLMGVTAQDALYRSVDDVIPQTGLLRVLETGISEINQRMNVKTNVILTTRSPLLENNTIIGAVAVFQDITSIATALSELEYVKNLTSTLESVLESIEEGIVVVDKQGLITRMNKAYGYFLGINPKEIVGKHITTVITNTRLHIVARSGNAEVEQFQKINDNICVVTRIPITKNDEIIGCVGNVIFKDAKNLDTLAAKFNKLHSELEFYKEEFSKACGIKYTFEDIIGKSKKIDAVRKLAFKAAKSISTVLILGESGTGKELFAHAIHAASSRRQGPFIKVNCAALPESLLESELFGYDEGAFTGARRSGKPGKFELANGGTIFLDEIGEMPISMQVKILRVLQEREMERVGATKTTKLDIRIIAATNRNLEKMIDEGQFRQDLYYRLNVFSLVIPPLRERIDDIPLLCDMLLRKICNKVGHWVYDISPKALELMNKYNWPGNVRELENILERTINLMDDEVVLMAEHLPPILKKKNQLTTDENNRTIFNLELIMNNAERLALNRALEATRGNKSTAAKILGITRSAFYQKLKKHNLDS
ncbi:transcriptional regulator with PAS [Sporomusaceae bacterium BoRhaA]|uniref:sigma-54 interaction domain-containing protein n=1 Tax=Pelorhabdus rhamnosifermentans TaxID=2772457 RepID=UPI001C061050|nr:sigma-54-dependent Fis family transcriptional regulator [Pelorhabdus rhamnosifermentans]MBU2703123.1 transcriptional regulator with PAS [Pelorhabdus rhamnosifermentans]